MIGLQALERERKFYFSVMVFLLVTLLKAFDKIGDAFYADIVIYGTGAFMLGNALEHGAKAWAERGTKPEAGGSP